jgi:hypothetical protein
LEIVIGGETSKFHVKDFAIREKRVSYEDLAVATPTPHFQAIVADRRKKKDKPMLCRLRFEDDRGNFLGLEQDMYFDVDGSEETYVNIAIDIPDSASKVVVTMLEREGAAFSERNDFLIGGAAVLAISFLLVFAAKGFFGWQ